MQYADSLKQVLMKKISKAEQDLMQLKLDYCRFVYGLSHRAKVRVNDVVYVVRHVDVDVMRREGDGFTKPAVSGSQEIQMADVIELGTGWELVT